LHAQVLAKDKEMDSNKPAGHG